MQFTSPLFLILSTIIAIIVLFIIVQFIYQCKLRVIVKGLQTQLQANELVLDEFKGTVIRYQNESAQAQQKLDVWQLEVQQVSQQLEHRIKVLQTELAEQKQCIEENKSQQPEDKLYSRAQKMVLLGADVAELIRECDLPKAEAEMLVALHNKKEK